MIKQVIILRKDLNMRKGKMVAQGAHASMKIFFDYLKSNKPFTAEMNEWINGTFTKICVSCNSEDELLKLYNDALELNIPASLILDSGKTEFNGISTHTAVAIGPDESSKIDQLTKHLSLL